MGNASCVKTMVTRADLSDARCVSNPLGALGCASHLVNGFNFNPSNHKLFLGDIPYIYIYTHMLYVLYNDSYIYLVFVYIYMYIYIHTYKLHIYIYIIHIVYIYIYIYTRGYNPVRCSPKSYDLKSRQCTTGDGTARHVLASSEGAGNPSLVP